MSAGFRRCVLCRRVALAEARRSARVGWEPVCEACLPRVRAMRGAEIRVSLPEEMIHREARLRRERQLGRREYRRRYYQRHKDRARQALREWRARNKERYTAYVRAYQQQRRAAKAEKEAHA